MKVNNSLNWLCLIAQPLPPWQLYVGKVPNMLSTIDCGGDSTQGEILVSKKSKLSLLGVTLVTPALTAGAASASVPRAAIEQARVADHATLAAARLKSEMLNIAPAAKLRIAGDRVPMTSLSGLSRDNSSAKVAGNLKVASNIATNNAADAACARPKTVNSEAACGKELKVNNDGGMKIKPVDRTNTDIRECWGSKQCSAKELALKNKLCKVGAVEKKDKVGEPVHTLGCSNQTTSAAKC
jgi:hypothetical protein